MNDYDITIYYMIFSATLCAKYYFGSISENLIELSADWHILNSIFHDIVFFFFLFFDEIEKFINQKLLGLGLYKATKWIVFTEMFQTTSKPILCQIPVMIFNFFILTKRRNITSVNVYNLKCYNLHISNSIT